MQATSGLGWRKGANQEAGNSELKGTRQRQTDTGVNSIHHNACLVWETWFVYFYISFYGEVSSTLAAI